MAAREARLLFDPAPTSEGAPDNQPYRKAMQRAGRLLAARSRSEYEMTTRLERAGFDPADVAGVVDRLRALGLLDDQAFARQWVAERSTGRGPRLLDAELRKKGIDGDTIEAALSEARRDELAAAREQACSWVKKVAGRPLAEQARRVQDMLLRRGFSYEATDEAVRSVLPPEGWD